MRGGAMVMARRGGGRQQLGADLLTANRAYRGGTGDQELGGEAAAKCESGTGAGRSDDLRGGGRGGLGNSQRATAGGGPSEVERVVDDRRRMSNDVLACCLRRIGLAEQDRCREQGQLAHLALGLDGCPRAGRAMREMENDALVQVAFGVHAEVEVVEHEAPQRALAVRYGSG